MPAGSKTDPPLAKAKPISASVITYLRRRKTLRERELLQPERGVRRCKKLCRHQGQCRRRGRRCSRRRSRDPPAAHGEGHGEAGCPPAAHGGRMRGCRDSTCSPWRTPRWSRWRHLKEAVAHGKPTLEQVPGRTCAERSPRQGRFAGRTCDPMGDPTLEQSAPEGLHPMGETMLEQFVKDCSPWERLTLEQGNDERSPPPEDEEAAETP
ncbi:hypothetical protein GRJ2_000710800 [Grus japonensis]|uniref:Uncharacterized protein n=1 Tax=Grus japonensis TaxID=30415 RepID=A0ABC9WA90_GRUJA